MSSGVPTRRDLSPAEDLDRATADYLSVSRGGHLFASPEEHQRAEQAAWERLQAAREAVERESADPAGAGQAGGAG
ncbi:MAG: hypothetical protein MUE51_04120 [Thermoleophilia bacterium]|jgi:hypothetical protein|nr:hypothetical protein [Thermoleophilia bacterium]